MAATQGFGDVQEARFAHGDLDAEQIGDLAPEGEARQAPRLRPPPQGGGGDLLGGLRERPREARRRGRRRSASSTRSGSGPRSPGRSRPATRASSCSPSAPAPRATRRSSRISPGTSGHQAAPLMSVGRSPSDLCGAAACGRDLMAKPGRPAAFIEFRRRAAADQLRRGARARRPHRPRRDRRAGRARLGGAPGPLRRLDRHVLAGQRQVGRLRRGLRLLRAVALRRGRHADARDDGAGPDPRARQGGRGRGRPPLLHGHPGPGPLQARLRQGPRGRPAGLRADQPEALRLDRPHVGGPRPAAEGGRHPAGPSQRRVRALLLPGGLDHRPLRGPAAHDRRRQGGRARDLRRRHPQPRRVAAAAGRDGLRARRDRTRTPCRSTCSTRAPGRSSASGS